MSLKDLKITTYDGPDLYGGQSVGVVGRGITVEHVPTGLRAHCSIHRSQIRNRDIAVSMLEWGLAEAEVDAG